ncbi:MAG: RNA methyltransferase [Chloroflexi bacterium]|nr:RNA methyltransferase [Chloroflexota bacterium]
MKIDSRIPTIVSASNKRIVEARKLRQRKHRQAEGLFLVEGLQLLHMALDSGAVPYEVFFCQEQFIGAEAATLLGRFRQTGAALLSVSPRVMETLSEREEPQGIVASFRLAEAPLASLDLAGRELVVILDRLQDPGNLGTLIRTADAVGAAAIILIEPCVDPYDPKTVRGSMGSLFNLPVISTKDVSALFAWLKERGLRPVGADPHLGETWGAGLWQGGVALVLGNEARGLSDDVAAQINAWAKLPIVGRAESLNVAVAGGVLMYAWLRENLPSF